MAETRGLLRLFLLAMTCGAIVLAQGAPQGPGGPQNALIRQGSQLDLQGKYTEARAVFQQAIDGAATPMAKANAERAMAMSFAFQGNCSKTAEYEKLVIDYWKTQEKEDPAHAFYQEGEMADEAARVCVDSGDLSTAHELYSMGRDYGLKEPDISPARKDLWHFRFESADARVKSRRGDKDGALKDVMEAKQYLDDMEEKDANLYQQQQAFMPYTKGYVALYTGDYQSALMDLQQANQRDPFIQCLIGMTYEKLGDSAKALDAYRQAAQTNAHNPPAAFAKPFATKKLVAAQSSSQN